MLAQNFKTPADLGIQDAEFEALVKVLGMLERREIAAAHFTMDRVGGMQEGYLKAGHGCGTAGCLLGWARFVADRKLFEDFSICSGSALCRLFMFACESDPIHQLRKLVTPAQAAIGLRNFLTTGEACWTEVMAE